MVLPLHILPFYGVANKEACHNRWADALQYMTIDGAFRCSKTDVLVAAQFLLCFIV